MVDRTSRLLSCTNGICRTPKPASCRRELAGRVQIVPLRREPRLIAGLDCAFSGDGRRIFAAAVLLEVVGARGGSFELKLVETVSAERETTFPYIPGLLSFREAPVCLEAAGRLSREPDLYVIDGQGVAHPRRLGLASHLGLFLDKPTIGCAKSRLIGTFDEPGEEKGAWSPLRDRRGGDRGRGPDAEPGQAGLCLRRPQVHAGGCDSYNSCLHNEISHS